MVSLDCLFCFIFFLRTFAFLEGSCPTASEASDSVVVFDQRLTSRAVGSRSRIGYINRDIPSRQFVPIARGDGARGGSAGAIVDVDVDATPVTAGEAGRSRLATLRPRPRIGLVGLNTIDMNARDAYREV